MKEDTVDKIFLKSPLDWNLLIEKLFFNSDSYSVTIDIYACMFAIICYLCTCAYQKVCNALQGTIETSMKSQIQRIYMLGLRLYIDKWLPP